MNKIHLMGTALIALLLAACSAEMPIPDGPGQDSGLWQHRKSLSMKQVPNRLKSVWATLPHSGASTRSESDIAAVDSVFSVPTGEFLATYDPTDNTWSENPAIRNIDTIGNYGYAVADVFDPYDTIKDPGDIMKSTLDNDDEDSHDECDILCGKRPGVSPTAYCRKVHILTGLNP